LDISEDADSEDGEEHFIGWSAIEEAASHGQLTILKRLGPDPARDDFDDLYRYAKYESIIAFLVAIQPPKDLTRILSWHFWWLADRFPGAGHRGTGTIEALFKCGVRWEETDPERISQIRRSLLKIGDYELKTILSRLRRPEICAPETYQELMRTPRIRERLLALGLVKKPVSEQERRRKELAKRRDELPRCSAGKDLPGATGSSPAAGPLGHASGATAAEAE